MEGGLSVEQNHVAVADVSLHDVADLQVVGLDSSVGEFEPVRVVIPIFLFLFYVDRAGVLVFSVQNQLLH